MGLQDMATVGCGVQYDSRVFLVCATGWVVMPSTQMGSRKSRGLGEHAELEAGHGDFEGQGAVGRRRLGSSWTHGAPSSGEGVRGGDSRSLAHMLREFGIIQEKM